MPGTDAPRIPSCGIPFRKKSAVAASGAAPVPFGHFEPTPLFHVHHDEPIAADARTLRLGDPEGKPDGNRRVDGVATAL